MLHINKLILWKKLKKVSEIFGRYSEGRTTSQYRCQSIFFWVLPAKSLDKSGQRWWMDRWKGKESTTLIRSGIFNRRIKMICKFM